MEQTGSWADADEAWVRGKIEQGWSDSEAREVLALVYDLTERLLLDRISAHYCGWLLQRLAEEKAL